MIIRKTLEIGERIKRMDLLEIMQNRRSVRKYTGQPVAQEDLQRILEAGLFSASSRGIRPWELIVVRNKDTLQKMSQCRVGSAKMLAGADAAIAVIADTSLSDVWVEDCSIVMSNMHLMADSLGVGSCWIQGRLRKTPEEISTEDYLRKLLKFPENFALEAILSLGMPESHPTKRELSEISPGKIHEETF